MNKVFLALTALAFCFAASTAQAEAVYFDSGSAKVNRSQVAPVTQKKKVWVPAHRSKGRLVRGHYVWR
jgi:hypothetical protein